jgi:heavy metal sensor kinase
MSWKKGAEFLRRTDTKLTLWYVLSFLTTVLLICGILYFRMRHQLTREIDRFLVDETKELGELLTRSSGDGEAMKGFESGVTVRTYYPVFFCVLNEKGVPVYTSKNFKGIEYGSNDQVLLNALAGRVTRKEIPVPGKRRSLRILSTPLFQGEKLTYIIQMGTHLHYVRKSLSDFQDNVLAIFPVILIIGTFGGWILARRSLSPIGYIASAARRITSRNLGERLVPRGTRDELDALIETINGMIARLENAFKRMAEFTADASHELKTPICALRGDAEVLLARDRTPEEYQEGLARFIEQFDHLTHLINDLILLSKVDALQVDLRRAPLRLDLLLKDLARLFEVLAEQKGLRLEMEAVEEVTLNGDKTRLQQVFTNLLDNAIKYTNEGRVRIIMEEGSGAVRVKVSDTGIGIAGGEQKKIFRRFYRVDKSRSRETGGAGLGLSIAEGIVAAHNGTIEVESRPDRGSTFTVTLPLAEGELQGLHQGD